jgi:methylmalonyl-CoA mutase N-terminal domain/subunit
VSRRKDSIVGVNQYANPKEKPLATPPAVDESFHRRRAQQVAAHRTSLDDEANSLSLGRFPRSSG